MKDSSFDSMSQEKCLNNKFTADFQRMSGWNVDIFENELNSFRDNSNTKRMHTITYTIYTIVPAFFGYK